MKVFLGSPGNQMAAACANGFDVLLSHTAMRGKAKMVAEYAPSFKTVLVDSGAFSEHNSPNAKKVDLAEYVDFCSSLPWAWACAALDDVGGDYDRSLRNLAAQPGAFPTFHPNSDPPSALPELISIARERGSVIGIGLEPPRHGAENARLVFETLQAIPTDIWAHGWALAIHSARGGRALDSFDSCTWFLDAMAIRTRITPWLTYAECVEISIKKLTRQPRASHQEAALPLFDGKQ